MTKFYLPSLSLCLILFSCGRPEVSYQTNAVSKDINSKDKNLNKHLSVDTSKIAILAIDSSNHCILERAIPFQLTKKDIKKIYKLLNDCINSKIKKEDTTKRFSQYINLKNYKRQYVPFINSKGEKKVYINCFCFHEYENEFEDWKKSLVEVEDGGKCYFHLIVNLTNNSYEKLYTNGYG